MSSFMTNIYRGVWLVSAGVTSGRVVDFLSSPGEGQRPDLEGGAVLHLLRQVDHQMVFKVK